MSLSKESWRGRGFDYPKHFKKLLYEWRDKVTYTESKYGSSKLTLTKTSYTIQAPAFWPATGEDVKDG